MEDKAAPSGQNVVPLRAEYKWTFGKIDAARERAFSAEAVTLPVEQFIALLDLADKGLRR